MLNSNDDDLTSSSDYLISEQLRFTSNDDSSNCFSQRKIIKSSIDLNNNNDDDNGDDDVKESGQNSKALCEPIDAVSSNTRIQIPALLETDSIKVKPLAASGELHYSAAKCTAADSTAVRWSCVEKFSNLFMNSRCDVLNAMNQVPQLRNFRHAQQLLMFLAVKVGRCFCLAIRFSVIDKNFGVKQLVLRQLTPEQLVLYATCLKATHPNMFISC